MPKKPFQGGQKFWPSFSLGMYLLNLVYLHGKYFRLNRVLNKHWSQRLGPQSILMQERESTFTFELYVQKFLFHTSSFPLLFRRPWVPPHWGHGLLLWTKGKAPIHIAPLSNPLNLPPKAGLTIPYMQKAGDSWDISPQFFLYFPQNFRLRTRNQYCTQAIAWGSTI